ncbi:MAG: FGGY family carbohydrate kinase [Chitinophagaceae bacterium]
MLLLGIDIGTSSVKVSVVDAATAKIVASVQHPETEREIITLQPGWAEQVPAQWWADTKQAILKAHASKTYDPKDIQAIGIAYQMHGLVCVDKDQQPLRNSIIWCDSRAVPYGDKAFETIGEEKCLSHLLNSPGNFTAAKLAWVKEHEPQIFGKIDKIMLPGDFIAMQLTGEITTSISALSEGIFWDLKNNELSKDVMDYFGFETSIIPEIKDVFTGHGGVSKAVADELSLSAGIPVTYKAGDQPNNALSLNVLEPGEVAATAGTSGVIYGVSDQLAFDQLSRVNTFAHVNHTTSQHRLGVLLCINGAGSMNRWSRQMAGHHLSYTQINDAARAIPAGSEGLQILPFGNGAERMLCNKTIGASIHHIDLNIHTQAHFYRASQEGIAFAFRYGLDIMRQNGMVPRVIRAGRANMFLSDVFAHSFVNATNVPVELYESDGSIGAAIGAGIGMGCYASAKEAFSQSKPLALIEPVQEALYDELYQEWKAVLDAQL